MTTTRTAHTVLTVTRLEKRDTGTNEYKQYTGLTDRHNTCLFGFSRIGAKWQWSIKSGGDAGGRCDAQLATKTRSGYFEVWADQLTVPTAWVEDPKTYARQLQDMAERAYRGGSNTTTPVPDDGEQKVTGPLESLLDECRATVSEMAVSPDGAMQSYARLVGQVERATDDLDVVNGYLDTLRTMIGAAQ